MDRISNRFVDRVSLLRVLAAAALLVSSMAGLAGGVSSTAAANPLEFNAAAVTPADVAGFFAVSLDENEPQFQLAQTLVARILGVDQSELTSEDFQDSFLPEDLGLEDLPPLENGQAAIVAQQQDLTALLASGMFDSSAISDIDDDDSLSDISDAVETIDPEQLSAFAVVITADNIEALGAEFLEDLEEEAAIYGDALSTSETADGSTVTTIEMSESDYSDDLGFRALAQVDGAIILGFSDEGVLPFVQAAEGDIPSLADDADYQAAMGALPSDVLFGGYSSGITDEYITTLSQIIAFSGLPLNIELIVQQTGPTGFALIAAEEGFRMESATIMQEVGLASPVPAASRTLTLDQKIPADTLLFINGQDLGASQLIRTAEQLILLALMGTDSEDASVLERFTEASIAAQYNGLAALLGFNARTDLMQQLVGEYGFAVSSIDLLDPNSIGVLLVSDVEDGDTVDEALIKLGALLQILGDDAPPIVRVTVGDNSVNQMTVDLDGSTTQIQFGVINDQLLVGIGTSLTDYALGGSTTLESNPVYAEAMSYLPEAESGIYFVNVPEVVAIASSALLLFASVDSGASFGESTSSSVEDANERCSEFNTQAEAQEAYDEDPVLNFFLDLDFDGVVCEDYFAPGDEGLYGGDDVEFGDLVMNFQVNIGGLAVVTYDDGDIHRMSGILVVPASE